MSEKIDPLEKAAECARMIEASDDPMQQKVLSHLQALWANLAVEKEHISEDGWAEMCDELFRIHDKLIRPTAH